MSEAPQQRSPADLVLDLAFYAPLGLAVTALEAVPGLARKGRDRLAPQVGLARTVGQIAVRQGYRQISRFRPPIGKPPAARPKAARTGSTSPGPTTPGPTTPGPATSAADPSPPPPPPDPVDDLTDQPVTDGLAAAELAIPSYDSLSAPQVLQRLDGLSRDEVAAVMAYEAATRRRRTILDRAEQLLA
jgi:hypothetical protein